MAQSVSRGKGSSKAQSYPQLKLTEPSTTPTAYTPYLIKTFMNLECVLVSLISQNRSRDVKTRMNFPKGERGSRKSLEEWWAEPQVTRMGSSYSHTSLASPLPRDARLCIKCPLSV